MAFRLSVMPGFSTLPGNLYDPLIRHLYGLQVILAFLIIFGGIGFPILFNYGRLLHYGIRNKIKCSVGYELQGGPRTSHREYDNANCATDHFNPACRGDGLVLDI